MTGLQGILLIFELGCDVASGEAGGLEALVRESKCGVSLLEPFVGLDW